MHLRYKDTVFFQLEKQTINIPKIATINAHPSLLPKYRGPAPIQWAILNGEKKTGVSIMRTELGLDTGNIYLQKEINIEPEDTSSSVFDKLATLGVECLEEFLNNTERRTVWISLRSGKILP